jgi:hypothetical protein
LSFSFKPCCPNVWPLSAFVCAIESACICSALSVASARATI